jgi:hypothetical protein
LKSLKPIIVTEEDISTFPVEQGICLENQLFALTQPFVYGNAIAFEFIHAIPNPSIKNIIISIRC